MTYEAPGNGIQLKRKSAVQSFRHFLMRINRCEEATLDRRNKPHEDK